MRLINPEEFAYDLNTVTNGYWLEEAYPEISKWVTRKISLFLQRTRPDLFPPVTVKKSMMSGIKTRIEANGLGLSPLTDFDVKDAQAGTLFHYRSAAFLGRRADHFLDLRLSPLIEWMIQLKESGSKTDLMKITYEVALVKLQEYEARCVAAAETHRLMLEQQIEKLRERNAVEFQPIRIEVSKDWIFQIFYTEAEFLREGTTQRNCVHWSFYQKFLRSHTLVGGLRKASAPEMPYISIELGVQNFHILQAELANHVRHPREAEPVSLLQTWVEQNRDTLKLLRNKVFEYKDVEIRCQELHARQGSGEASFTVRLTPPNLE